MPNDFFTPAGVISDFYVWLWWASEKNEGMFDLGDNEGRIELWVDEKLAFRNPDDTVTLVSMGGLNPSETPEAAATLRGGKVVQDIRLFIRRDERDFYVTLKGADAHFTNAKFPQLVDGGGEEEIYDRMFLYEELHFMLCSLFALFTKNRISDNWRHNTAQEIREWLETK